MANYLDRLRTTLKVRRTKKNCIFAYWWPGMEQKNWGDALNPILIRELSGLEPVSVTDIFNLWNNEVYSMIGSVLGFYNSRNLVIWGSGFMSSEKRLKKKPKKICAVRGPMTRKILRKQGFDCPEVYGDASIIYPLLYSPKKKKKFKVGIIPHYVDQKDSFLRRIKDMKAVKIIDILGSVNKVVDDICQCEKIASSSLHGIIAADAYNIPSLRLKFSEKISGGDFKFDDYFSSVGRKGEKAINVSNNTELKQIYDSFNGSDCNYDVIEFIESCPFMNKKTGRGLMKKIDRLNHLNR